MHRKFTQTILLPALAASIFISIPAAIGAEAASAKQAKNAVLFRQSLFQLIRSNMGPLGAMAKGQMAYDTTIMKTNAERLSQLAAMVPDYMATDTRKFDLDTDAKDDIWDNTSKFNNKANALYEAAMALQTVVKSADESQYRKAIGKIGGSCKGCHDSFKKD